MTINSNYTNSEIQVAKQFAIIRDEYSSDKATVCAVDHIFESLRSNQKFQTELSRLDRASVNFYLNWDDDPDPMRKLSFAKQIPQIQELCRRLFDTLGFNSTINFQRQDMYSTQVYPNGILKIEVAHQKKTDIEQVIKAYKVDEGVISRMNAAEACYIKDESATNAVRVVLDCLMSGRNNFLNQLARLPSVKQTVYINYDDERIQNFSPNHQLPHFCAVLDSILNKVGIKCDVDFENLENYSPKYFPKGSLNITYTHINNVDIEKIVDEYSVPNAILEPLLEASEQFHSKKAAKDAALYIFNVICRPQNVLALSRAGEVKVTEYVNWEDEDKRIQYLSEVQWEQIETLLAKALKEWGYLCDVVWSKQNDYGSGIFPKAFLKLHVKVGSNPKPLKQLNSFNLEDNVVSEDVFKQLELENAALKQQLQEAEETNALILKSISEQQSTPITLENVQRIVKMIGDALLCPISQELLEKPMVGKSGHTFSDAYIQQSLNRKKEDPLTREMLTKNDLTPNRVVEQIIPYIAELNEILNINDDI